MITLEMHPKDAPKHWTEFCETTDPFSIALDGYVNMGPLYDPTGPRQNFNHHEGVSRLETRSTCAQVLMAIRQGLFERFRFRGEPTAIVWANDCDEDVCLAYYLLSNHFIVRQTVNPILNRLVFMEDMLDATAGAYPFISDLPALDELAWVFEPYRQFRLSGALEKKDASAYMSIVTDVCNRISAHTTGHGGSTPVDTRYERIGGGKGWIMAKEIGAQAKTGIFADGHKAYVTVRERGNGIYTYVIGRMSPYIRFDIPDLLKMMNGYEGLINKPDCWGGGDTVGGSPRVAGSKITPDKVEEYINFHLEN